MHLIIILLSPMPKKPLPTRSCSNLLQKAIKVQMVRNVRFQKWPFLKFFSNNYKPALSVCSFTLLPAKTSWRIFSKYHHYHQLFTNSIHIWLGINSLIYLKHEKPQLLKLILKLIQKNPDNYSRKMISKMMSETKPWYNQKNIITRLL